jgi:hypothetical protein
MRCAIHPDVETNLRCGKCGQPICPKCMVQTPVGARCPKCARQYKLPTYRVSSTYYLRAAGTALGMAVVCGLVWGVISGVTTFFFLNIVLAAGAGYAIGEVVSLAVNRKRGRGLSAIGGAAMLICYLVNIFSLGRIPFTGLQIVLGLVAIGIGIYVAVNRLR